MGKFLFAAGNLFTTKVAGKLVPIYRGSRQTEGFLNRQQKSGCREKKLRGMKERISKTLRPCASARETNKSKSLKHINEPYFMNGDIKKIAVLRANALGDLMFVLPALEALKKKFPNTELVYLGNEWHKTFLENRPGPVDRVVVVPKCHGIPHESDRVENEAEVNAFFQSMQEERFDIAFQMHGGGRNSNPFVKNLGAQLTVGLQAADAPPLDINVPYFLLQQEVLRYLEVVAQVGTTPTDIRPQVEVTLTDLEELEVLVKPIGEAYAVLHPGATDIQRRWPIEKFAMIGDILIESGVKVYITGSLGEGGIVDELLNKMQYPPVNVCGKLSINALAALLSRANVVISNDTGPLHLARAVGAPTVGLYWAYNMVTAGAVTAQKNRLCVSWNVHCPGCGMDCTREDIHHPSGICVHNFSFVDDISVKEVTEKALELIGGEEPELKAFLRSEKRQSIF